MKLLTKQNLRDFAANAKLDEEARKPIVKFFMPVGAATWLISEYDPDSGIMFGLCDLGMGTPELGTVSFTELQELRDPLLGLGVERDRFFEPDGTLADYADQARREGRIVA
ncbi:MAG: transposase [Verrucomicrobiales bacterium]|nr:transposase [Verrucomicrobiales bacterium]|tara:strand:- start:801 stop:1133 length:333 start_codon:yes stop_codon:yes gene_type:complete